MAVRVVNEDPDKSVVKKRVCRSCGVTVEYLPIDVQTRNGTDWSGGPDGEDYVMCPKCGKKIILRSW